MRLTMETTILSAHVRVKSCARQKPKALSKNPDHYKNIIVYIEITKISLYFNILSKNVGKSLSHYYGGAWIKQKSNNVNKRPQTNSPNSDLEHFLVSKKINQDI